MALVPQHPSDHVEPVDDDEDDVAHKDPSHGGFGGEPLGNSSSALREPPGGGDVEEPREGGVSSASSSLPARRPSAAERAEDFRYGKFLWLFSITLPVASICTVWSLFADRGCGSPALDKRNVLWFQWVWDMAYVFIAQGVAVGVLDTCFLNCLVSNWSEAFRARFYTIAVVVGMAVALAQKVFMYETGLYASALGWLLVKTTVINASVATFVVVLCCVLWRTSGFEQKKFAVIHWVMVFVLAVWALLFYICNQVFVQAYEVARALIKESSYSGWLGAFDYCVATFFTSTYVPCWGHAGRMIGGVIRETAPPILKERIYLLMFLWVELFATVFSRMVFRDIEIVPILVFLVVKDSALRWMDFGLRYSPARMIRIAMREERDEQRRWRRILSHMFALFLDVDLSLTLELICGHRSHHHHAHHLPDGCYATAQVMKAVETHKCHISRASWRIAHQEATPGKTSEEDIVHDASTPPHKGMLHWEGAMRRYREHHALLGMHSERPYTTLDPGLRAIQWCAEAEEAEDNGDNVNIEEVSPPVNIEDVSHALHLGSRWRSYCGLRGCVTRAEVKDFLRWSWQRRVWKADDEFEAEALCDRICYVQRNIRVKFVAVYLARLTSSLVGISFLYARRHFPCTLAAYGMQSEPDLIESLLWPLLCIGDALEVCFVSYVLWHQHLEQAEHVSWRFVGKVLWDRWFILTIVSLTSHIIQDSYVSMYVAEF